ncbi:substrate-binding periplasmic protein [Vibrio neptunius]|uniref:substrate-binding periplasmic protein n=1 Tax=Vibrio neptunius TaxID=170651 RepID=UPI0019D162F8|nr:transporter substrate-binding domain-containing protein [Vibrio neptunius]MBN3572256.1 transporter substrate-binding domain-containing protein [Vibrio neptunius]QXX08549.1 transporter substrate-binding domain-containing protein [Vibrio neptunius]
MRLFLLACVPFLAQGSLISVKGTQDVWPPYFQEAPNTGKAQLILIDIFEQSGFQLDIKLQPWNRALKSVRTMENDVILGAWKTGERERFLYFSQPYYWNEIVLLSRHKSPLQYSGRESLTGFTIGVQRGYRYSDDFEQLTHFKKYEISSAEEGIEKLIKQRVDAILVDKNVLTYTLKNAQINRDLFHISTIHFSCIPLHVATSKENSAAKKHIDKINTTLSERQVTSPCIKVNR